ncbi:MAG: UDP-N-acetylglucosamine 2-epimerase (non-hydrolyzing) [Candidatus Wallbacteria bacterium]|nr:UDP-N-acetylglucosamine 2-epimerase (non-hydrolyzing) [Candidatus Wallbacteria bacterium]
MTSEAEKAPTSSKTPRRIACLFGTRPEAIKLAPIIRRLRQFPGEAQVRVIVTAQHRQMLDQVLKLFRIQPDRDLDVMRPGQDLFDVTSRMLLGLKDVLREERPELLIVQGDTTSVFASALAGYYLQIPVAHVEAGLRTHRKFSPFPEEMNRKLATALADLHFAPTARARKHLLAEGVDPSSVFVSGNTVIDALLATVRPEYRFEQPELASLDVSCRLLLVTAHRRESFGQPFRDVCGALLELVRRFPDVQVLYPVHLNPNIRGPAHEILGKEPRIRLMEPLEYEPFVHLMARATVLLTDSGGVQEEAPSLGKPVLVLRETTERPEAVEAGTVRLVGTDRRKIVEETSRLLSDPVAYEKMARAVNPYGDGRAAERIVARILGHPGATEFGGS